MNAIEEEKINEKASNIKKEDTSKSNKKTILLIIILIFFIMVFIIIILTVNNDNNSNTPSQETSLIKDEIDNNHRDLEDVPVETKDTEKTSSCAPIFAGGDVVSYTSTETTWSYYFSDATRESVSEYVEDLKSNGWLVISEKIIVNTSFWDFQKENCCVSLRFHSTDGGVILEIKNEIK